MFEGKKYLYTQTKQQRQKPYKRRVKAWLRQCKTNVRSDTKTFLRWNPSWPLSDLSGNWRTLVQNHKIYCQQQVEIGRDIRQKRWENSRRKSKRTFSYSKSVASAKGADSQSRYWNRRRGHCRREEVSHLPQGRKIK